MATHDYIVDNQNGANFRSDLNNALAAIVSNNSSATAPTTTYAFMLWADTASDLLKQRNAADSAWVDILTLSTGAVSNAEVADNAITLAKMAHGTDGEIITYDSSGAPATVGVGTSGQVLTSNGAGSAPSMQDSTALKTASSDLNNDLSVGFYLSLNGASNAPYGGHGSMVITGNETNTVSQHWTSRGTINRSYFRNYNGTTWTAWTEIGNNVGVGQTWTDVTSSRVAGTTYTNSSLSPIMVLISTATVNAVLTIDGLGTTMSQTTALKATSAIIPSGSTYSCNGWHTWFELA